MSHRWLPLLAVAFAALALLAGGAQLWAFIASSRPRHLILAIFAVAVGIAVSIAAGVALWRKRRRP